VEVATLQKLAQDKGFQDSLQLYNSMPAKQVKAVFMGLDDETVVNYLQSMQPRRASMIIKEFKTPDELSRIARVLEIMRQSESLTRPSEKQTPSPNSQTARTN
jgi:Mg/Co/Ni transporter MgtE